MKNESIFYSHVVEIQYNLFFYYIWLKIKLLKRNISDLIYISLKQELNPNYIKTDLTRKIDLDLGVEKQ